MFLWGWQEEQWEGKGDPETSGCLGPRQASRQFFLSNWDYPGVFIWGLFTDIFSKPYLQGILPHAMWNSRSEHNLFTLCNNLYPHPQILETLFNFLPVSKRWKKTTLGPKRVNVAQRRSRFLLSADSIINLYCSLKDIQWNASFPRGGGLAASPRLLPQLLSGQIPTSHPAGWTQALRWASGLPQLI